MEEGYKNHALRILSGNPKKALALPRTGSPLRKEITLNIKSKLNKESTRKKKSSSSTQSQRKKKSSSSMGSQRTTRRKIRASNINIYGINYTDKIFTNQTRKAIKNVQTTKEKVPASFLRFLQNVVFDEFLAERNEIKINNFEKILQGTNEESYWP